MKAAMSRAFASVILAFLQACGSSTVAPTSAGPFPVGTFVFARSTQDSTSQRLASPVPVGRTCVTFGSTLRFDGAYSVVATRQFFLPGWASQSVVTEVDTGVVMRVAAGTFQLSYPGRPYQTRFDTASTLVSDSTVVQLSTIEHFGNTTDCLTDRITLSYRIQGS